MKFKTIAAPMALGLVLSSSVLGPAAPAAAATKKIPSGMVAQIVNKGLDLSRIHLNSFGPRKGNSYHKANSSFVNLYGVKKKFNIPEFSYSGKILKGRRYIFNVSSITSRKIRLTPEGKYFDLTIHFEEKGPEVKGMCRYYRKRKKSWKDCVRGADRVAPDLNWKRPAVRIRLQPQAYEGGIAFRATKVVVGGEFQAGGICRIGRDLCDLFTGYKGKIKRSVAQSIMSQINNRNVKRKIARTTRNGLSSRGIPTVKALKMGNGYIRVTY